MFNKKQTQRGLSAAALLMAVGAPALAQTATPAASGPVADEQAPQAAQAAPAAPASNRDVITVTARRVEENAQEVPIPVSVLDGGFIADSGAFNAGKLAQLVPSVQFFSQNPRNTNINIRGLGAPYGLTNDGIEQGVGVYVDGVYYARPAAAVMDFIDVERIEVLRGPQGTLYGKNTTAGAINIITKGPSFTPESEVELSYGNYGFVQGKGTIAGPLTDTLAYRASFSGTQRDGVLYNRVSQDDLNDLNNIGARFQLLWRPNDDLDVKLTLDNTEQRPEGYALVFAGVVPTQRPLNRQFAAQAAFFNYTPPQNPFDRVTDLDVSHRSGSDFGGAAINADWDVGGGTLTAISAWRYWLWDPANDRDYLGLPIRTLSQNPSKSYQWSHELRYAGDIGENLSYVAGAYWFNQVTKTLGREESGSAAWRFVLNPNANAQTPGLLNGYGQRAEIRSDHTSSALFGQLNWEITPQLTITPGIRYNVEEKSGYYRTTVYGGLQTSNQALIDLQRSVFAPQNYSSEDDDNRFSYNLTGSYKFNEDVNVYATYSTAFKTFGLNNNGIPSDTAGNAILSFASIKPEDTKHIEVGLKSTPFPGVVANFTAYQTKIDDYQVSVGGNQPATLRGYLANADKVTVKGAELDSSWRVNDNFKVYANVAYADGKYDSFPNAPPALEDGGGAITVVDASGTRLPGLSKWQTSIGGEYSIPTKFSGRDGEVFFGVDASSRSEFSGSATESDYLNIDGYSLVNARFGFRGNDGWDLFVWGKNIFEEEYYELLVAGGSNSGYYAAALGDPKTFGVTLRLTQ